MHITTAVKLSQCQPAHVYWTVSRQPQSRKRYENSAEKPSSAGQNSPFQVAILMKIHDDQKVWCKVNRAEHKTLYAV